jgi:hypothetical protein
MVDRLAQRGPGRPGGHDVHPGGGDVGLHGVVAEARPPAGEPGQQVLGVDGADGEGGGGHPGVLDGLLAGPGVPGRDHEQGPVAGGEPVDGLAHGVGAVGRPAAQAHVGDPRVLLGRPLHPGDDARLAAEAGVVEHLAVEQAGAEGDALALAAGLGAGAGDDRGDVGAVAEVVGGGVGVGEVGRGHHLAAGQVRVGGVDAGVEHRHLDALAGQPGRPGGRGADLGQVGVEVGGPEAAVQPQPAHPGQLPGGPGGGGPGAGQGGPQLGSGHPRLAHGGGAQARQLADRPEGGRSQGRRPLGGAALDDQGKAGGLGVGVAHAGQRRHVEQLEVEQPPDQPVDVAGDHVEVAADGHDLEGPARPGAGGREHLHRLAAAGLLAQQHLVAGHQGDGDGAGLAESGRPGGGPGALGGGPRGRAGGGDQQRGHREQDGELADTSRGAHRASSDGFVPWVRFTPNVPTVQGGRLSATIL